MTGENEKKHSCPDCNCCQWCSEERCRLCLSRTTCKRRKLSFEEQIALYDALEKSAAGKSDEG